MWDGERGRERHTAHSAAPTDPLPKTSPLILSSSCPPLSLSLSLSPRQNMTDISSYLLDSRVIFIGSRITDDVSYV
jgi:hypothetical protein